MKRIVFRHPDGIYQIVGVVAGDDLAVTSERIELRGRVIPFASLYKVTTRAAYYKEPLVPSSYIFHRAQV